MLCLPQLWVVSVLQALLWKHWLLTAKHGFSNEGWYEIHNVSVNEEVLLWSLLLFVNPFIWGSQAIRLGHNKLTFFLAVPPVSWVTWMSFFMFLWDRFSYSKISMWSFYLWEVAWQGMFSVTTHKHCYFSYNKTNFPFSKQLSMVDPLLWMPLPGCQQQTLIRLITPAVTSCEESPLIRGKTSWYWRRRWVWTSQGFLYTSEKQNVWVAQFSYS